MLELMFLMFVLHGIIVVPVTMIIVHTLKLNHSEKKRALFWYVVSAALFTSIPLIMGVVLK